MEINVHFLPYLAQFFLEWKMFQTNILEKIKTHNFFKKLSHLWDNVEKHCRAGQAVRHTRIACWISKATNICSEHVILIDYLLQQWLHKCTSMLHYMNIACLVSICRLSITKEMNKVCQKIRKYIRENKNKKSCIHIIIKFFVCHKFQSTLTFNFYRDSLFAMLELIKDFYHIFQSPEEICN